MYTLKSKIRMCGVLLKCMATSHVFLFVPIKDLWFLNLTLNSVVVVQRIVGCISCNCRLYFLQLLSINDNRRTT